MAVSGRSADKLKAAVPQAAHVIAADLMTPGIGDRLAEEALSALGQVDILVNNSGGPPPTAALATSAEVWTQQFGAMVLSLIGLTSRLVPGMRERTMGPRHHGRLVGRRGPDPEPRGVQHAARSAAWLVQDLGERDRGRWRDGQSRPARPHRDLAGSRRSTRPPRSGPGKSIADIEKAALASIPAARYGSPDEFAAAAVFLASPQASYITGTTIRVDGGALRNV